MQIRKLLVAALMLLSCGLFAQEKFPPDVVSQGTFIKKTIPLRDMPVRAESNARTTNDFRIIENNLRGNPKVNDQALPLNGDPIAQKEFGGITTRALEENFDGATASEGQATPPDPTGAVGPNHYVHAVNLVVKIFDKSGNLLAGPTFLGDFLGSGNNSGDPIVMYDHLADRWFVSQFNTGNNGLVIGVSDTNDPTGAYNVYQFPLDAFPDYPHYSVWHDAYYMTANKFSGNTTYALERDALIAGDPSPQIIGFNLPGVVNNTNTVFSPEPANLTGTTFPADVPAYITYLQDDGWAGVTFDHLKVWEIELDWVNTGNSTISAPLEIPTDPFDSVFAPFGTGDVNQPGTGQKIDMIGGVISYAANYRSFGSHNSWVITFNVDTDGNDLSGVRWIELRNDNTNPWSIFQEGTYVPADGHSRFMGSAAMDAAGNIGLAFNIASGSLPVGIRYTGRFDGDPLGQMTVAETTIVDGVGVQTNTNRFGDYSHLTMDPDNFTFWHTAEYFSANNFWRTRVASFTLSGGFANDVGVSDITTPNNGVLTNAETVEISIRNYGTDSQSNISLELRVDGNLVASETFSGTIAGGGVDTYQFTQTVDLSNVGQTYVIEATTVLAGDEFPANDAYTKNVTHLIADDVGVVAMTSPSTGDGLGNETVSIVVRNFGGASQSNFDVQYTVNNGTPVVETFTATINAEEEVSFDFAQTADLSAPGAYVITARTSLAGDADPSNDPFTKNVSNICIPEALLGCNVDGIKKFVLNTIDADDGGNGCNTEPAGSPNGYADRTHLSTTLPRNTGSNVHTLQAQQNWTGGPGVEALSVWIDFDDSGTFEASEQLIAGEFFQQVGVLEDFTLTIPTDANLGSHRLRAKAIDTSAGGDVNDPCGDVDYGETQDYTVIIDDLLGVNDPTFSESDLIVTSQPNNQFEIVLNTSYDGPVFMSVYNVLGQQLLFKNLVNEGQGYTVNLNMSHVSSGVYLIKLGSQELSNSKNAKIVVK